jgi:hypothetical protein
MVRRLAAALTGVLFFAGFAFAVNRFALAAWPAYAEAFPTHSFTPGMLLARLVAAIAALLGSGFIAERLARGDRIAVVLAASALLLLGGSNHFTEPTWSHYPLWYHIAFTGLIAPSVVIGGNAARRVRS